MSFFIQSLGVSGIQPTAYAFNEIPGLTYLLPVTYMCEYDYTIHHLPIPGDNASATVAMFSLFTEIYNIYI